VISPKDALRLSPPRSNTNELNGSDSPTSIGIALQDSMVMNFFADFEQ